MPPVWQHITFQNPVNMAHIIHDIATITCVYLKPILTPPLHTTMKGLQFDPIESS